jgi:hypothetical protein
LPICSSRFPIYEAAVSGSSGGRICSHSSTGTNWNAFGMLLDEHVREYARRSSRSRGAYRPVRGGKMPEIVLAARLVARKHLPWLFREYDRVVLDEFASLRGQLFIKKSKLLSRPGPVLSKQCGDPIGDRFSIAGVDVGRPPTRPMRSTSCAPFSRASRASRASATSTAPATPT